MMTKEEFVYELIDQWLYPTNLQCMLKENYTQRDQGIVYKQCTDKLFRYIEFYNQVSAKADNNQFTEEQVDSVLELVVLTAKHIAIKNAMNEITEEMCEIVGDSGQEIMNCLFVDDKGRKQDMDKSAVMSFGRNLRIAEEDIIKRRLRYETGDDCGAG